MYDLTFEGKYGTMHGVKKLRDLQKRYDDADFDFHDGILGEAADTIEMYVKWLEYRDNFIIKSDMWLDFIKYLEENNA